MKRLIAFILATGLIGQACAETFRENPDYRASIGINYSESSLGGNHTYIGYSYDDLKDWTLQSSLQKADASLKEQEISLDLRVPVSNDLTLNVGVGQKKFNLRTTTGLGFDTLDHVDLKGNTFSVGARYYIGH